MSYTPNTWAAGDTITAQKLNNMEQGIASAGASVIVHNAVYDNENYSWTSFSNASTVISEFLAGSIVLVNFTYTGYGSSGSYGLFQIVGVNDDEVDGYKYVYFYNPNNYSFDYVDLSSFIE